MNSNIIQLPKGQAVGNVSFCDNEKCMFHGIDIPEDKFILELEPEEAPSFVVDILGASDTIKVERALLINKNTQKKQSFCQCCMGAIQMVTPMRVNR